MRLLQNEEGSGKGSKIILCVLLPLPSTDDLISQIVFCIFCYYAILHFRLYLPQMVPLMQQIPGDSHIILSVVSSLSYVYLYGDTLDQKRRHCQFVIFLSICVSDCDTLS